MDDVLKQLAGLIPVLVGATLGFLSASLREALQSRRRTSSQVLATSRCFYARPSPEAVAANPELPAEWIRSVHGEEADADLFFVIDVLVLNRSYLQDAVTEAWLVMPCGGQLQRELAEERPGRPFFGQNIAPHSLAHIRLLFRFVGVNARRCEGFDFDFKTTYRLELTTIGDRVLKMPVYPGGMVPAWDYLQEHVVDVETGVTTPRATGRLS